MDDKHLTKHDTQDNNGENQDFVIGIHAATAALQNQDNTTINKVFVQKDLHSEQIHKIEVLANKLKVVVSQVPKAKLDLITDRANHQGVAVAISAYEYYSLDELLARIEKTDHPAFILILDGLEDPHNLGSILRTADATGVDGVIIPKHRAVGLTQVVAKTSTGAIETVPVVRVTNISQTIDKLKENGIWIFGTAMAGQDYRRINGDMPLGLVIGNEGKGISKALLNKMDETYKIPMVGSVQSLNASVAAGVLMYQVFNGRNPLN